MGPWGFLNPSRRGRDLMDGAVRAACLSGILGGGRFARDMAAAIDDPLATHALGLVKAGDVVGLGSGRAAGAFVRALGARVRDGLRIRGVPTSEETERLAREVGINLVTADKLVETLGARGPLPVEVLPFAAPFCRRRLDDLGLKPTLRMLDERPFVTDNFNVIFDCATGPIVDPPRLEQAIRAIPGVIDTGLFLGTAAMVIVADGRVVRELVRRSR